MKTKHPWRHDGRFVKAGPTNVICEVPQGGIYHGKIHDKHCRLIAAAPELLAACELAIRVFRKRLWDGDSQLACEVMRSAIVKAKKENVANDR